MGKNTTVRGTPVRRSPSPIGDSTKAELKISLIKQCLFCSLSWKTNKYCHDISELSTLEDCELCASNPYVDLSPLYCCKPTNRSSCCSPSLLELPSVLTGPGPRCRAGQLYSKYKRRCITLYI